MGKPRMIILIRHAQSEGNKNRSIHQTVPDHRVKLTPEGQQQALTAGRKLRSLLRPDDTLHFFTSPYRRTRETTEGILESLTADDTENGGGPSPFKRQGIKVYEEPRLREQDFGNFQPCSAEMERMWHERADYGHFFYRIPNGESAADAYDRVSGFNESLWRLFGEDEFASVCILVTHGLMTRVFLMKWYHFSVEYFEDLRNVNHCEFVVMKKSPESGRYILQNQLRTWTELKRERQAALMAKGQLDKASSNALSSSPIPIRKKWGGCPVGCTHGVMKYNEEHDGQMPKRKSTVDLFMDDDELDPLNQSQKQELSNSQMNGGSNVSKLRDEDNDSSNRRHDHDLDHNYNTDPTISTQDYAQPQSFPPTSLTVPPQPLSFLSPTTRQFVLASGRDGGGSRSGAASPITPDSFGDESPSLEHDPSHRHSLIHSSNDVDSEEESDEAFPNPARSGSVSTKPNDTKSVTILPLARANINKSWGSLAKALHGGFTPDGREHDVKEVSGMDHGAMADALGDHSDVGSDGGNSTYMDDENDADDGLSNKEKEDKSLKGSVY